MKKTTLLFCTALVMSFTACEKEEVEPIAKEKTANEVVQQSTSSDFDYGTDVGLLPNTKAELASDLFYDDVDEIYYAYFHTGPGYKVQNTTAGYNINSDDELEVTIIIEDDANSTCTSTNYLQFSETYLDNNNVNLDGEAAFTIFYDPGNGDSPELVAGPTKRNYKGTRSKRYY